MTDKKAIKEAEGYLAACVEGIDDYEHELVGRLLEEYRSVFAENCAAKKMRNEIVGLCSLGEHHIREFAGNTNYNCLIDAVKEFDRVSTERECSQDGINDRGSDEYANPNTTTTTSFCGKCGNEIWPHKVCGCVGDRHT